MAQVVAFLKIIQDGILPVQKTEEQIRTTNTLFRVHVKYLSSAFIVTGFSLFIQQLFIDHLKCFRPKAEGTPLESATLGQFCSSVAYTRSISHNYTAYPPDFENVTGVFQQYFQWVPFLLIFEGVAFHFPQFIWRKCLESGKLQAYCAAAAANVPQNNVEVNVDENSELNAATREKSDATGNPATTQTSFAQTLNSTGNVHYFYSFLFCELLNILIVLISYFAIDCLIYGHFLSFGTNWMSYLNKLRRKEKIIPENPLELAFPTLFSCLWEKIDPATSELEAKYNVHCIMALNFTHQKIFLVLWFTLIALFVADIAHLMYRLTVLQSRQIRRRLVLKEVTKKGLQVQPMQVDQVTLKMNRYDWFIFRRILSNLNATQGTFVLNEVATALLFEQNGHKVSGKNRVSSLEMEPMAIVSTMA